MFWFLFISKRSVYRWKKNGQIDKLIRALKKGNYKVRLLAIEALGDLKSEIAITPLIHLLNVTTQQLPSFFLNIEYRTLNIE